MAYLCVILVENALNYLDYMLLQPLKLMIFLEIILFKSRKFFTYCWRISGLKCPVCLNGISHMWLSWHQSQRMSMWIPASRFSSLFMTQQNPKTLEKELYLPYSIEVFLPPDELSQIPKKIICELNLVQHILWKVDFWQKLGWHQILKIVWKRKQFEI